MPQRVEILLIRSSLGLISIEDFTEAAKKVVELAK